MAADFFSLVYTFPQNRILSYGTDLNVDTRATSPVSNLDKSIAGPLSARQGSWRADNGPL